MVITEFYKTCQNGVKLYRSYSNTGMRIRQEQTDIFYDEAIDVENSGYTYVETDIPIGADEEILEDTRPYLPAQEALDVIMGEG